MRRRQTILGAQRSEIEPSGPMLAKAAVEPPAVSPGAPTPTQFFSLFPEGSVSSSLKCLKAPSAVLAQ